jgi:hypothetical protein
MSSTLFGAFIAAAAILMLIPGPARFGRLRNRLTGAVLAGAAARLALTRRS